MAKKYGGVIERWYKIDLTDFYEQTQLNRMYGPNLGFIICGFLPTDPTGRGFERGSLQTSLVVKFSDKQVETLNTIYDLGEPKNV